MQFRKKYILTIFYYFLWQKIVVVFGDYVNVQNNFLYQPEGSIMYT